MCFLVIVLAKPCVGGMGSTCETVLYLYFLLGMQWHVIVKVQDDGVWPQSIAAKLGSDVTAQLSQMLNIEGHDLLLLAAGEEYDPVRLVVPYIVLKSAAVAKCRFATTSC